MSNATPEMQPLAVWNPTRGIWEKPQLDLFARQEQFWETWPTCGMTRNGWAYPLPQSAHPTPDTASSSSPTALFRTPLASDASRGGESLQQVKWGVTLLVDSRYQEGTTRRDVIETQEVHPGVQG